MAIRLDTQVTVPNGGGNNNITLGGSNNDPAQVPWANPFSLATALTVAITLRPFHSLQVGGSIGGYGRIASNVGSTSFRGTFQFAVADGSTTNLSFSVWDGRAIDGNQVALLNATTIDDPLVLGQWLRIVCRWRAVDHRISIWINGRERGLTISRSVAGAPTHLTDVSTTSGPLEIGAHSVTDARTMITEVAEIGLWTRYISTGSCVKYGRGWSPRLLPEYGLANGMVRDVTGRTDQPLVSGIGSVTDELTGTVYGSVSPAQGIFEAWTRTPHPLVYETEPPTEADEALLPARRFEPHEKSGEHLGTRSGNPPVLVTTGTALRNALLAAQPGDTITVDHTQTLILPQSLQLPNASLWTITPSTPRMPPRSQRFLTGAVPLSSLAAAPVALGTPSCESCEPSYVLVQSSAVASLPTPTFRTIPLPTGEVRRVLHEGGRVSDDHYPLMPVVRGGGGSYDIINNGSNAGQWPFNGVCFRGLRFQTNSTVMMWVAGLEISAGMAWTTAGNINKQGRRLLFNQCALESDWADTGGFSGQIAFWDGSYFGIVNSYGDKWCEVGGGDAKLFFLQGNAPGPHCWENNHWRATTALWFAGGSGSSLVNGNPNDVEVIRNALDPPLSWLPSEINPGPPRAPWVVNISAGGAVTSTEGRFGDFFYGPEPHGIMYELATGIARRYTGGYGGPLTVSPAWPTLPATGISVAFQRADDPDPDTQLTIYNSGLETPMPTATFTNGSQTVTFSAALPAGVKAEATSPRAAHYLYPNNTFWPGTYQPNNAVLFTPTEQMNGWGFQQGRSRAQNRRGKIQSIAADRLSCTLTYAWPGLTTTFPYSAVVGDGLYRNSLYHYKGSFENKRGERWVLEGNLFGHTTNRIYVLSQPIWPTTGGGSGPGVGNIPGTVTIQNDVVTLNGATWADASGDHHNLTGWMNLRAQYGAPYPHVLIIPGSGILSPENYSTGRIIERQLTANTAKLLPPDPRRGTPPADFTNGPAWWLVNTTPWNRIHAYVMRYNLFHRGTGPAYIDAESTHGGMTLIGGQVVQRDNLFLRQGGQSWPDGPTPTVGWSAPAHGDHSAWNYGPGGQPIYDEPFRGSRNAHWRAEHNSHMRVNEGRRGIGRIVQAVDFIGAQPPEGPSSALSYSDNLLVEVNGIFRIIGDGASNDVLDTRGFWGPGARVAGNVVAGDEIPTRAKSNLVMHRDNAAVLAVGHVGLANYTAPDGFDLANYAVTDIATVTGFTIDADGLSASLPSGSVPATVRPGHNVQTTTHPEHHRVIEVGPLYSVVAASDSFTAANGALGTTADGTWVPTGAWTVTSNRARLADGGNVDRWARRTTDVGQDDYEVEATITELTPPTSGSLKVGVIARATSGNNFMALTVFLGGPMRLTTYVNGVPFFTTDPIQVSLELGTIPIVVGDRLGIRCVGNDFTAYLNGWALGTLTIPYLPSGRNGGIFALTGPGGAAGFDDFRARTAVGRNGIRWTGPAHPEAGATNKSLLVTFRGTAANNTDPGADLTTLAAMIQGVRDPARMFA